MIFFTRCLALKNFVTLQMKLYKNSERAERIYTFLNCIEP